MKKCVKPASWWLVLILGTAVMAEEKPAGRVPFIYGTDLFHPHDDPDDHFDLATIFAMPELDVKAILLDLGTRQKEKPGRTPIEQMFKLTGRRAPYAVGLSEPLKSPNDPALDQPREYQAAVDLLIRTLRNSPEPMVLATAGSVRDVCVAFNREPDLLRRKISKLYINIGNLDNNREIEWNVKLDPHAYVGVMRSGLPIYWCPCMPFGQNRSTHWIFRQGELFDVMPVGLRNYFIYALHRVATDELDPIKAINMDLGPWRQVLLDQDRNMWCTGPLVHAAGRTTCRVGEEWIATANPIGREKPADIFNFIPARVDIDDNGQTTCRETTENANMHVYKVNNPQLHTAVLKSCLRTLLRDFPLSQGRPAAPAEGQRPNITCEASTGRIIVHDGQGPSRPVLLVGATAAVVCPETTILTSDNRYQRVADTQDNPDPLAGPCQRLICKDTQSKLDLEWRITVLNKLPGIVFELVAANVSSEEIRILRSEPLRVLTAEGGGCLFGATGPPDFSRVRKALTNGRIYYDPGRLVDFSPAGPGEMESSWNIAFFCPETRETMVAGYLENREAEGTIRAGWCPAAAEPLGRAAFNLAAHSQYNDYYVLKPGSRTSSGRLLVLFTNDPHDGLETYARLSGQLHQVRLNPIINGWCSWFVTYGDVTEQEILKHAEHVARELKPYGMEWIQIDDGYQTAFGNWEGNSKFPHGMKWLASKIRELGLRPGLWTAPYAISANTAVAKDHPEWLVHEPDGRIQKIVQEHQQQAQYILDITHPEAKQWLSDLFRTITRDWGYDFIKTDFVEWTILAARRYHDPAMSKAAVYRMGCDIMRQMMGPDRHLLDCGPAPMALGLIDSMRIQLDRPMPPCTVWEHYSGWYNSVIPAVAKRYYFHRNAWINDPDHLRTRDLTIPQAQAAATILGLAGGTVISGDRLYDLDVERLGILKKILPSYGQTARPLDLFDTPLAETFALKIEKPFGAWWLVGCFNGTPDPLSRPLHLPSLGMDPRRSHLVYDFWTQKLLGKYQDLITVSLEPTSVRLLVIREQLSIPQVLGTDRHITAGAVELDEVKWNPETNTLSGIAVGGPSMNWTLAVHCAQDYSFDDREGACTGFRSVRKNGEVLRGMIQFDKADRVQWSLRFKAVQRTLTE